MDSVTAPNRVTIQIFVKMRIGWLGRLVGKWKTGYWPPYALAKIEYAFGLREPYDAHITFHGSTVPSQRQYVNWRRVSDYRMDRDMSRAAYEGSLRADGTDAPCYRHTTFYRGLMEQRVSSEEAIGRGMVDEEESGGGLR